jgi:GNAT superfamily N-acetyltransferase
VTSCRAPTRVGAEWRFEALLALVDGEPAGLALFFPDFLTWRGGPGLYLENRYVRERARRRGSRGCRLWHPSDALIRIERV